MPRSTREWARRKLSMVHGNLDQAAGHLQEVARVYEELHPEVSEPLVVALDTLANIYTLIDRVRNNI